LRNNGFSLALSRNLVDRDKKKEFQAILGQNYHFQGKLVPPSNTDQTTSIRVKK
jgi:hypothetical protein